MEKGERYYKEVTSRLAELFSELARTGNGELYG